MNENLATASSGKWKGLRGRNGGGILTNVHYSLFGNVTVNLPVQCIYPNFKN
jgi:hypothetical protein